MTPTPYGLRAYSIHAVWCGMKNRCSPKNDTDRRARYYDRGICVCAEWRTDFIAFSTWARTHGWEPGLQLDRRDNDGNYCPENCRFVTRSVNASNRGLAKNNTSGYTGVRLDKATKKWASGLMVEGQRHYLGLHITKEDALKARNDFILNNNLPHPIQN